jgi:hypothetical protein
MTFGLPGSTGDKATQPNVVGLTEFAGLNVHDTRSAINDQECSELVNFFPIGKGNLRTMYGVGTNLYGTAGSGNFAPVQGSDYIYYFTMVSQQNPLSASVVPPVPDEWLFSSSTNSAAYYFYNITQNLTFTVKNAFGSGALNGNTQAISYNNNVLLVVDQVSYRAFVPFIYPSTDPNTPNQLILTNAGPGSLAPTITLTNSGSGYGLSTTAPITATIIGGSGSGAVFYPLTDTSGAVIGGGYINSGSGYEASDVLEGNPLMYFTDNAAGQIAATFAETSGAVTSVTITTNGSGWIQNPQVNFGGTIASITITQAGSGYTAAPKVTLYGGGGTYTTATATLSGTTVASIAITGSANYISAPIVVIAPPPSAAINGVPATASAVMSLGTTPAQGFAYLQPTGLKSVVVKNGGYQYNSPPTVVMAGGASTVAGTVASITVINGGNYYYAGATVTISGGGGSGATAGAVTIVNNVITAIAVANPGSGYTSPPNITISGAIGSGAIAAAVLSTGASTAVCSATLFGAPLSRLVITNPGVAYSAVPTVTVSGGGGSGAVVEVVVNSTGSINALLIINPGSGYTSQPIISFSGGAPSVAASAVAFIDSSVNAITVISSGSGYQAVPLVVAVEEGGAIFAPTLTSGAISTVSVVAGGRFLTAPTLSISDATGTGATLTAVLGPVGLAASMFYVVNAGIGYPVNTTIALTLTGGGGSGGTAEAVIDSLGTITSVTILTSGSGYTSSPAVTFTPPATGAGGEVACVLTFPLASVVVNTGGSGYTRPSVASTGTQHTATGLGNTNLCYMTATGIARIAIASAGTGYAAGSAVYVGGAGATGYANYMPIGVAGSSIEIFENRVWIGNKTSVVLSAPGGPYNFSSAEGSSTFTIQDQYLKRKIVALKQINGFLYVIGDSSVYVVSNVNSTTSTTGGVTTTLTTFSVYNVDPQVGTVWRDTVQQYGYGLIFMNPDGVYLLTGGAAQKISSPVDGYFINMTYRTAPEKARYSAAVATIFGIRSYVFLLDTEYFGASQRLIVGWNGGKWFTATQTYNTNFINSISGTASTNTLPAQINLQYICTKEVDTNISVLGTDGNYIFDLFNSPDITLPKIVQSKLFDGKNILAYKQVFRAYVHAQPMLAASGDLLTFSVDTSEATTVASVSFSPAGLVFINQQGQGLQFQNIYAPGNPEGYLQNLQFGTFNPHIEGSDIQANDLLIGFTVNTYNADVTLIGLYLAYKPTTLFA